MVTSPRNQQQIYRISATILTHLAIIDRSNFTAAAGGLSRQIGAPSGSLSLDRLWHCYSNAMQTGADFGGGDDDEDDL